MIFQLDGISFKFNNILEETTMNYAKFIDHTLLKPESTRQQIDQIIDEAKEYNFKSICVNLHM